MDNTPYDDVFRTLLNDCSQLILPLINETFHENYTGNEQIEFAPNEHFLNQQDGYEDKRITDSSFTVYGTVTKKYHWESQSTEDNSMLIRIFEYDAQIALDDGVLTKDRFIVTFPNSAILYLRSNANIPDAMRICIVTPGGDVTYDVPTLKIQHYTLKEIFDKNLLFLIPFYIFTHEKTFPVYNKNNERLQELKTEYAYIKSKLEELCDRHIINEYTKCIITDMSNKVLEHIALKFDNVKKGVKSVMGGKVLEHEAKQILNEGIREGMNHGLALGKRSLDQFTTLTRLLLRDNRLDDLMLVTTDETYRNELLEEYGIFFDEE